MAQGKAETLLGVSAGGQHRASACFRNQGPEVTLHFPYSSGYDTIELLGEKEKKERETHG